MNPTFDLNKDSSSRIDMDSSSSDQNMQKRISEQIKKDLNMTNETSASLKEHQQERNKDFNEKVIEMSNQAMQHPLIE